MHGVCVINFKYSHKSDIFCTTYEKYDLICLTKRSDIDGAMIDLIKYRILVLVEARCDNIEHVVRLNASVSSLTNKSNK